MKKKPQTWNKQIIINDERKKMYKIPKMVREFVSLSRLTNQITISNTEHLHNIEFYGFPIDRQQFEIYSIHRNNRKFLLFSVVFWIEIVNRQLWFQFGNKWQPFKWKIVSKTTLTIVQKKQFLENGRKNSNFFR